MLSADMCLPRILITLVCYHLQADHFGFVPVQRFVEVRSGPRRGTGSHSRRRRSGQESKSIQKHIFAPY